MATQSSLCGPLAFSYSLEDNSQVATSLVKPHLVKPLFICTSMNVILGSMRIKSKLFLDTASLSMNYHLQRARIHLEKVGNIQTGIT